MVKVKIVTLWYGSNKKAIVLSSKEFNESTGFIVVCPITNSKKRYPFEVELPEEGISLFDKGYPIRRVILIDQIKSFDWKASGLKVLKKYDPANNQVDEIIDDCLAKIETYLT